MHKIGTTEQGFEIYQYNGGEAVDFAYFLDEDGNRVKLPHASTIFSNCLEWLRQEGETTVDAEWSETGYSDISLAEQEFISWREFHDQLEAAL
jgi:hypothetical protein